MCKLLQANFIANLKKKMYLFPLPKFFKVAFLYILTGIFFVSHDYIKFAIYKRFNVNLAHAELKLQEFNLHFTMTVNALNFNSGYFTITKK
jgi:hypothetical protein